MVYSILSKAVKVQVGFSLPILMFLLTACAQTGHDQASVIPSKTADVTAKEGVFTQPIGVAQIKPGCVGECPTLRIDSLVFPGNTALTAYVDQHLAQMAQFDNKAAKYATVSQFKDAYWAQAGSRDEAVFSAKTRYKNKDLTVVEMGVWHYPTGAAHGMSQTRFVNWDNKKKIPVFFNEIVLPEQKQAFNQQLEQAYDFWLSKQDLVDEDPAQYKRVWPFQSSENIALTDAGVVVKYNSYEIAPYALGQPELFIAYPQLKGVLHPKYTP